MFSLDLFRRDKKYLDPPLIIGWGCSRYCVHESDVIIQIDQSKATCIWWAVTTVWPNRIRPAITRRAGWTWKISEMYLRRIDLVVIHIKKLEGVFYIAFYCFGEWAFLILCFFSFLLYFYLNPVVFDYIRSISDVKSKWK